MQLNRPEANSPILDGKEPGIEQTDLITLVKHHEQTLAEARLGQVYHEFETHQQDHCAVLEGGRVVGLCSRGYTGFLMGHRYGFAIYSQDPVRKHMIEQPLMLRRGTPVREALEMALGRQGEAFKEDVVLLGGKDEYLGMIPVPALVQLQSALVEERFRIQESMHRRLLAVSRQAGMAEVATGVLHNVGNVLNSVNVSATMAVDLVRESRITSLEKAAVLLEKNRDSLPEYLTNDPKGKLVPNFLIQLASRLRIEQSEQLRELDSLVKHIGHIKNIVSMQQHYAKGSGMLELLKVEEVVEDGLKMNGEALTRHGVKLERCFEPVPQVLADKHKLLQIMVNLIRNAKHACEDSGRPEKRIAVRVSHTEGRVRIVVTDNGVGVATENLTRIFNHGFTTRKDGHGFGLHSGALAAKELGGSLTAHSDGPGRGATFVLELPVAPSARETKWEENHERSS